jgi:hypothetical protein
MAQTRRLEHHKIDLSKGCGLGHALLREYDSVEAAQQNMVGSQDECRSMKRPQFAACTDARPITAGADQGLQQSACFVGSFWYISQETRRYVQSEREFWEWDG